jgi:glycosyltransferase involved in cell wall biosynthesis
MRILYSHRIQSRDGQSVHVEELVAAFRALGHEVKVVGPGFYDEAGFGGESRWVARLRRLLPGVAAEAAELAYNIPAWHRLLQAARAFRPELIYERCNLYYLAGAWLARRTGLPYVLEVNAPLAEERGRYGGLRLKALARATERHVWRTADLVLPVTEVLRQRILAAGVRPECVRVMPNGVVLERFPPPVAMGNDPPVLGFVGFVRDWHGLDAVIRGLADTPRVIFTVAGEGPARPGLAALAARLGVADRVRFVGLVAPERIPKVVGGFDIALQPRVVEYASPLKLFDYMAAGRAIVAPDQPNIREVLGHERTALLFDPAREGAMWAAIARLLGDASLRSRLGMAARAALMARDYTWRGNAARVAGWAADASGGHEPGERRRFKV